MGFRARRDTFLEACPRGDRVYQMSFIRQYDRLLVTTFGVVNLIRGAGGALEFLVALTDESAKDFDLLRGQGLLELQILNQLTLILEI